MRVDRLALNYSRGLTYSNPFYKNGDDVVSECIFVCDGCTKMAQIPGAEVRFVGSCLSSFFWLGDHAGHLDRVRRLE